MHALGRWCSLPESLNPADFQRQEWRASRSRKAADVVARREGRRSRALHAARVLLGGDLPIRSARLLDRGTPRPSSWQRVGGSSAWALAASSDSHHVHDAVALRWQDRVTGIDQAAGRWAPMPSARGAAVRSFGSRSADRTSTYDGRFRYAYGDEMSRFDDEEQGSEEDIEDPRHRSATRHKARQLRGHGHSIAGRASGTDASLRSRSPEGARTRGDQSSPPPGSPMVVDSSLSPRTSFASTVRTAVAANQAKERLASMAGVGVPKRASLSLSVSLSLSLSTAHSLPLSLSLLLSGSRSVCVRARACLFLCLSAYVPQVRFCASTSWTCPTTQMMPRRRL